MSKGHIWIDGKRLTVVSTIYTSTLNDTDFELNPYDRCIVNKQIQGKQCTIAFYVDNNKVSHVKENIVDTLMW